MSDRNLSKHGRTLRNGSNCSAEMVFNDAKMIDRRNAYDLYVCKLTDSDGFWNRLETRVDENIITLVFMTVEVNALRYFFFRRGSFFHSTYL